MKRSKHERDPKPGELTDWTQISQGAEAKVHLATMDAATRVIVKERFEKKYRIPELEEKIQRQRLKHEVNMLRSALEGGILVPKVLGVDKQKRLLVMEQIVGQQVKEYLYENKEI